MTEDEERRLTDIAGPVSRETRVALQVFIDEFRRWAGRINLAAASTMDRLFDRHVLDSAQVVPLAPTALRWLDLGSGGGFPGAVIAILLKDRPGSHVDLVESNRKKAAFLTSVLAKTGAPARVHAIRIEEAARSVGAVDVVTARALAPLQVLLELAEPWLENGGRGLFHKGREWRQEIEESPRAAQHVLVSRPSAIDRSGVILDVIRRDRLSVDGGSGMASGRKRA